MVYSSDCFRKDITYLQHLEFRTETHILFLRNTVCDNDFIESGSIDPRNGIAAEHAMGEQRIHHRSTLLFQEFSCARDGIGGIGKVIHENSYFASNISN